jgi:poly [ADP-ribose] polymerase
MEPVKAGSQEFKTLEAYARDTHGATHRHLQVSILNAFRVERFVVYSSSLFSSFHTENCNRNGETDAWANAGHGSVGEGERLLLWHGSRTTNFAGL